MTDITTQEAIALFDGGHITRAELREAFSFPPTMPGNPHHRYQVITSHGRMVDVPYDIWWQFPASDRRCLAL